HVRPRRGVRRGRRLRADALDRCHPEPGALLHAARVRDRHRRRAGLDGRRAGRRRADRGVRGARRRADHTLGQEHGQLRPVDPGPPAPAAGPVREKVVTRGAKLLAILLAAGLVFPWIAGPYALSVGTLILYFAYTTQAWNVMMGFAGQLSLGHALYVGV